MIAKNGEGVLGFITSHGYLADPTLRGMRWHLMKTFDRIYVLDLHGNANKKEVCPDGSSDKNVFDIMQGVAIIVAVKRGGAEKKKKPLAEVFHGELWGERETKYAELWDSVAMELCQTLLPHKAPQYPFVMRDYDVESIYSDGFSIYEFMPINTTGIQSGSEERFIDFDETVLSNRLSSDGISNDYEIVPYLHKPFDRRYFTFFENPSPFMTSGYLPKSYRARSTVSRHLRNENFALLFGRTNKSQHIDHFLVSRWMSDVKCAERASGSMFAPLYLYPEEGTLDHSIHLNFNAKLYARIRGAAGLTGAPIAPDGTDAFRKTTGDARPDEVKVFDYIYGALHCPAYRETYAEFLKIDFPRIPFPSSPEVFADISTKGEALRRLHLMEDAAIGETPFPFHGDGDSVVGKPRFDAGRIWINATQYFDNVPAVAWDFPIGGYQPAQKWLKDRKGRALGWDDIRHYQKIVKILAETDRIMREIELPDLA
jgi:predicted helicase